MNKFSFQTPKNDPLLTSQLFSPYDTLESLNFQAQKLLKLIENFANPKCVIPKLIEEVKTEISKLLATCELVFEHRKSLSHNSSKSSLNISSKSPHKTFDESKSKQDMFQAEAQYEEKIIDLEKQLKKSEESRLRLQSHHQDCLRQLDRDLDEILHDYKQKYKKPQQIGNILEELFSNEELEQERQVALGEIRESVEIKIKKIENSNEEKWDMNLDSEESSGPPPDLEGTGLILYDRLHDLKVKLYKISHQDLENLANKENSMDQAFLGSLPISMKSVSQSASIKLDQILSSLDQSEEKNEIQFEFQDNMLTLDEKENFIMTLIEKEGTNGRDVCLEDILSEDSAKKSPDVSLSFLEGSSKIKKIEESQQDIEKKSLENSKPDLNIRLSPITTPKKTLDKKQLIGNLSQESSIVMNDNNTSSFISENSFITEEHRKFKAHKKSEKNILRRPKISDHDDSNSSIFPPINTSSDDQSFRVPNENKILRRLPLVPCKPICAPPKERFNVRGRSLLPIQSSVGNSPKIVMLQENSMNKSASPNTVNKLRMRRYKEMTRPFIKILNKKLLPKEPLGLNFNNRLL